MWQPRRIMAGTDFSDTANDAAHVAFGLARRMGARVDLVHVMDPTPRPLTGFDVIDDLLRGGAPASEARERALAALGELAVEAGPPEAACHVMRGRASERLLGQRQLLDADLLVIGARGGTALRRLLLGSTAERALRRPGCPLLLVRQAPAGGEYKHILVGAEYPDRPTPWLECALALAHHLRAELTVLHVLPPAGYVSDAHHVELDPRTVPRRLERLVGELDATVPVQLTVRRGDPARVLPQVARRIEADLVVLGAERGPEGWPGRVADRVARAGLPSLLYVWPDEESDEDSL